MGKHKKHKDKKHESRSDPEGEGQSQESVKLEVEANKTSKKRKKSHKAKHRENSNPLPDVVDHTSDITECSESPHKKKKRFGDSLEISKALETNDDALEHDIDDEVAHKKKKKKRKHKDNVDEVVELDTGGNTEAVDKSKNKKQEQVVSYDSSVEETQHVSAMVIDKHKDKSHKKKKRKHREISEDDNLMGADCGKNRKTKQNGVDVSSRDKVYSDQFREEFHSGDGRKGSDNQPIAGQWNTASLGDENRQNKFLRLLGGFKQGGNTSEIKNKFSLGGHLGNAPKFQQKTKIGGNLAMDKTQEEKYIKDMERDYERAMASNLNRGIGLGFSKPPEEGKKFHIDVSKSKSIKFDS